ncbi:MAG: pyridoxamine 5'-phosphate oxidase family protein [Myxococcales bacterium]|nr:pyridoxamine 5'-phosphate oxidase family protein [Myxococcales bacterium]
MQGFDTAMLVTTAADDLIRARPMRITGRVTDQELWFLTASDSSMVSEIDQDFRAAVVMQDRGLYAFLSGMASIHDDPRTLDVESPRMHGTVSM